MSDRTHPRLASDIVRSYVGLGIGVFLSFPVSFAIGFAGAVAADPAPRGTILLISIFADWALIALILSILMAAVFSRPDSATLGGWLRATTPPASRRQRFWWGFNGGGAIYWAITGAGIAIVSLLLIVSNGSARSNPVVVGTGIAVVITSLMIIVTSFAVRYAREWATAGGLHFPGDGEPRFADFLYLSVQVTTTFGGSDVQLTTTGARKLVALHSVVAFAFNSVIVALLVSVLISAVN